MPNILTYRKGFVRGVDDRDAAAFIIAAGLTDHNQKYLTDQHVFLLKYASLWNKVRAGYMIIGGTATSHKFNYKNPADTDAAFRLAFTGGWTHASTGITSNGTTGYANTFLVPSTSLALGSASMGIYSRTNTSISQIDMGARDSWPSQIFEFLLRDGSGDNQHRAFKGDDPGGFVTGTSLSNRLHILSRTSTTRLDGYRDGVSIGTAATGATIGTLPTFSVYIGAINNAGTATDFSTRQFCYAFLGDGLSAGEAVAMTNAVNILQTGLGRNV